MLFWCFSVYTKETLPKTVQSCICKFQMYVSLCLSAMFHSYQTFSYFQVCKVDINIWFCYLYFEETWIAILCKQFYCFLERYRLFNCHVNGLNKWYLFCKMAPSITELDHFCTPLNHLSGQCVFTTKQRHSLDLG